MKQSQSGQISRTLIILGFVLLIMIGVVYGVLKLAANRRANTEEEISEVNEPPKPVYETTIGDIRFLFDSAVDLGSVIKAQTPYQQDIKTTEKFIYVTVRAQNKGKVDTTQFAWDIGNIIDAEDRNFIPDMNAYPYLPRPDKCGAILKPEFEPIPCVKIYQVSKVSKNLKIEVKAINQDTSRAVSALLDLKVR